MRTRIGAQVIVGAGAVTVVAIGAMAFLVVRAHERDLIAELERGANQLSETIKSSTHFDMLENRRDDLRRQIGTIGRQPGIENVRLFNREGAIAFSSTPGEIGRAVDKQSDACVACHTSGQSLERLPVQARSRIFRTPTGQRVLGIINPIHNEPTCATAACHAHGEGATVLGVLDVTVSLDDVDAEIASSRNRMVMLAAATIAATSLVLWWLNRRLVLGPVEALAAGTRRVAEGDLSTTIPVTSRHELGELASAFNAMTRRLSEAQRQLTQADKLASVGRLAAGVAHEINNPLTGVLTYASFLLKRCEDPQQKEDLEVIVRETKRCRDIVRGLLDFARQTPPRRQPADLNEVVRRAVTILVNQLSLHRIALRLDLTDQLPPVLADANQIQQVVVNLLVNAADAVGEGGQIHLATRRTELPAWGHAVIRAATCPAGCDLLDQSVRATGLPTIRVARTCAGREGILHLDPIYGRFNHQSTDACEDGALVKMSCPRCRASLETPEVPCPGVADRPCGAATYAIQVPGRGGVRWCTRNGCHFSRWDSEEAAGPRAAAEIAVTDTGHGVAAADLPRLFEPFFTTKGTRGTGLGLAVTWGIVEGHGGTIDVVSDPGKGSCFTVRLPLGAAL